MVKISSSLQIHPVISDRMSGHCGDCPVTFSFLGTLEKLRKETVNFVMSAHPPACNTSSPTGTIFMKFDILIYFVNLSRKIPSFIQI